MIDPTLLMITTFGIVVTISIIFCYRELKSPKKEVEE